MFSRFAFQSCPASNEKQRHWMRNRLRVESLEPRLLLDSTTVFNELMYHPNGNGKPEWVELHNQLSIDMDLSEWSLSGAIDYQIPVGTIIPAGGFLVVASDPEALANEVGVTPVGPSRGRLANQGESLELRDNNERVMDILEYQDGGDWPVGADGSGASLAKRNERLATFNPSNWSASSQIGGTPGAPNFPKVTLISQRSVGLTDEWRYDDSGGDLSDTWRFPNFDDTSWATGNGLLFDTDADLPADASTRLTTGRITYYFRTRFEYDGVHVPEAIRLSPIIDDGAVFYLNGEEILRIRMPDGPIHFDTMATESVANATRSDELRLPADHLRVGTNVLAVEVHQAPNVGKQVPINNGSFEVDVSEPLFGPSGWVASGVAFSGLKRVTVRDHSASQGTNPPYPAGDQAIVLRSNDGETLSIYQDLGVVSENTFRFAFSVADRSMSQWLNFEAALLAVDDDANETVIISGNSTTDAAMRPVNGSASHPSSMLLIGNEGDWLDIEIQGDAGPELIGQTLRVQFTTAAESTGDFGDAFEFALDNVQVSTEPTSTATDVVFGTDFILDEAIEIPEAADLKISEFASGEIETFWVEVVNAGEAEIALDQVKLSRSNLDYYAFPPQTLAPGEFLVLEESNLGFDVTTGDQLFLSSGSSLIDARSVTNSAQALELDEPYRWLVPYESSPNATNRFALNQQIVINEIMYHQRPQLSAPEAPATYASQTVVPFDSQWRYNESGIALETNWPSFPHTAGGAWQNGRGLLGYESNPAALPRTLGTVLTPPFMNEPRVTTYYFETEFSLGPLEEFDELRLRHVIDDGAVVYLNGIEAYRFNMSEGTVTNTTSASADVITGTISDAVVLSKELLRAGTNRISVEVHQSSRFSVDIVFGIELATAVQITTAIPAVPFQENDEEWVEVFNRGSDTVDLSGWMFVGDMDFRFPMGTRLAAGEFLVITNDETSLRRKYPELTNVIGDFLGRLSNQGGRLLLLDSNSNPADEVHYYDGGNWDNRADGNGPSLELVSPDSDNSAGSAWQASDESGKSAWRTYTYRGLASPTIPGEPDLWNEFALGLLAGPGQVLIDDLRVIEDPDGMALQRIQNGTFESGSEHWRFLGNHQRSDVIDDNGNAVLLLKSSGATEYQWNQLETTLRDDRPVVVGEEYEISFRARWLSGSSQLNARLYFNRLPWTSNLDAPSQTGTPGKRNSRWIENSAPTYSELTHRPLMPSVNEPITVSVNATDDDGIELLELWFRIDGFEWSRIPMTPSSGKFSATIPGLTAEGVLQFYVKGKDKRGVESFYPKRGPDSRALVKASDNQSDHGLRGFHVIMLSDDAEWLHDDRNILSNERLGGTVVFGNEVYYDVGVRLKGSFVGRDVPRVGFSIAFPSDRKFRGMHRTVAIDRSMHALIGVDEILIHHIANHAGGIPSRVDDVVRFYAPRPEHNSNGLLRMAGFNDLYLDSQFPNGSDGTLYEYEVPRWAIETVGGDSESLKRSGVFGAPNGFANVEIQDLGKNKEAYRWTNLITNNRTRDDYEPVIRMGEAFSATGDELFAATRNVLDIDQWMRTAAYQSLLGPTDSYSFGAHHNFRLYARPSDGKILYMPWDWDSSFQRDTSASLVGGGRLGQIIRFPANLRMFYGHMLDIVETTYNEKYMSAWTDYYGNVAHQEFNHRLAYIDRRSNFVANAIPLDFPKIEFDVSSPASILVDDTSVVISGTAWVDVREIRIAQRDEPLDIRWSEDEAGNASIWNTTVPLPFGRSTFTLEAFDYQGRRIGSETIEVESTASVRPLEDFLRVTELHYNPDGSDETEFIEFANTSSGTAAIPLDLTGVTIVDGPSSPFVFPDEFVLLPGEYAVVVANRSAFDGHYRVVDPSLIAGEYSGSLANHGERIVIEDSVGNEIVSFSYDDSALWPQAADGVGASLEFANPMSTPVTQIQKHDRWRSSREFGGSPGWAGNGPIGIIVSEVLARTDTNKGTRDAIELYNSTVGVIDISGWYLSDSDNDLLKFEIPAGTILGPSEYVVFTEDDFNPTPLSPEQQHFALNGVEGDAIWLVIPNGSGGVAHFVDDVHFSGAPAGVTWGVTATSGGRLVRNARNTLGCENSLPRIEDVFISEIQYVPGPPTDTALAIEPNLDNNDLEYLVVQSPGTPLNGWRIRGGVDFEFPDSAVWNPAVWIVSFDPTDSKNVNKIAAFRAHYNLPESTQIVGGYSGSLNNSGEWIQLARPDASLDVALSNALFVMDEVIFDDLAPWPIPTAGDSIVRRASMFDGNDGNLWTHGSTFDTHHNVPGDFNGDRVVDGVDVDLLFDAVGRASKNPDYVLNQELTLPNESSIADFIHDVLGTQFGDANLDGVVDTTDLGIWQNHRFRTCKGWHSGDFNGDGVVDGSDFNIWSEHRFNVAGAPVAQDPRIPQAPLPNNVPRENAYDDATLEPQPFAFVENPKLRFDSRLARRSTFPRDESIHRDDVWDEAMAVDVALTAMNEWGQNIPKGPWHRGNIKWRRNT